MDLGHLSSLSSQHVAGMLLCLESSFQIALDFDERPGLKFLIQKVFTSAVPANLYKQAVTAWTVETLTLFEVGRRTNLSPKKVATLCRGGTAAPTWFEPGRPVKDVADTCLEIAAWEYARVCRQLCKVESECGGYVDADRAAKIIDQDPFVFLLAADEAKDQQENGAEMTADEVDREEDGGLAEEEETVYCVATSETLSAVLEGMKYLLTPVSSCA